MAKDTPFGRGTRVRVLKEYFAKAGPVTDENAWEHVYRCLLWFNIGAGLAHIYDSNHMQKGGNFYARAVRFTDLLCEHWGLARRDLPSQIDVLFKGCVEELKRREALEAANEKELELEDEPAADDSEIESELRLAIQNELASEGIGDSRSKLVVDKIERVEPLLLHDREQAEERAGRGVRGPSDDPLATGIEDT